MIDYHTHLVPHGVRKRFDADDVREFARAAARAGLREVAITEHLYRFPDVQDALGGFWEADSDPRLQAEMATYFEQERLLQRLDEYVDVVREAAADPGEDAATIRLGLEVDLFSGRMDEVTSRLRRHPWDVLLGSVHWIGAWQLDYLENPVVQEEWRRRDPDKIWLAYTEAVEEIAASGACDVLAHVDLAKLGGVRPIAVAEECADRLVKAARGHDLAVELNTAGWLKPVAELYPSPDLLQRFRDASVPITFASDAHEARRVGHRIGEAAAIAHAVGYRTVVFYEGRSRREVPFTGDNGADEMSAGQ